MSGTDWFTYSNLQANTLARASDVNSRIAAIQGGFAKLPIPEKVQQGRATYVADSGTANVLAVSLDFAPASYEVGLELTVKVAAANSGAATINVNGLGAKAIVNADGAALGSGDLALGQFIKLVYDGTSFRLIGGQGGAAAAAASATAAAASATAAAISAAAAAASAIAAAASAATVDMTNYAQLSGANFTGAITVLAPTTNFNPATKKYVDDAVISAGAVTADESTIHSTAGVFSVMAGATAALSAVVGDSGAGGTKGLVPAPAAGDAAANKYLKANGTWAAIVATSAATLATPRTIGIDGTIVTGAGVSFDGSANINITVTALNVGNATAGTLAVARGGTGVTTSTGTGSVVLSSAPTLTNPVVGTQVTADNSTKAASTAYVQANLLNYGPAFLGITSISANRTLADADNNSVIFCTGGTARSITANSTPTAGFSCVLAITSTAAWSFSCAGGVYIDGATATVTSASIPAGSRCMAIHKGAGVWLLTGT